MRWKSLFGPGLVIALLPAVASAASNSNYYYAQTGVDGVIYCASAHATATGSPGAVSASGQTRSWKNLYCATSNPVPAGYLKATVLLIDNLGLCAASDQKSNTSTASVVTATIPTVACELGVYAKTMSEAAVNFAWRSGNVTAFP